MDTGLQDDRLMRPSYHATHRLKKSGGKSPIWTKRVVFPKSESPKKKKLRVHHDFFSHFKNGESTGSTKQQKTGL